MSFTLVLSTMIAFPYIDNQARTNLSIQTKLVILPYLEKNSAPARITTIEPIFTGGLARRFDVNVNTQGRLDDALIGPTGEFPVIGGPACQALCARVDSGNVVEEFHLLWQNRTGAGVPFIPVCDVTC